MTIYDPWVTIAGQMEASSQPLPRSVHSFAALGDSFTAGTGCPPDVRWADRLAGTLRARQDGRLAYGNYAEEGATSADLLDRQLNAALQLEPDLATVICGANDVLESVRPDIEACAERIAEIFDRLRDSVPGAIVITATAPERWRFLGLGPRTRRRVTESLRDLNRHVRRLAAQRGIPWLEVVGHPGLDDPVNFTDDGLHPSPIGHARTAEAFERLLASHLDVNQTRGKS